MTERLYQDDVLEIERLLIGHKVTKVAENRLTLDDGTMLMFKGNIGGCSCGSGDYDLTVLNGVDNIITNVQLVDDPCGDDYPKDAKGLYQIFVYASNEIINLATFEGSDGNGYYGTGYSILIERPAS